MKDKNYNFIWYPLTNFIELENNSFRYELSEKISPYMELNLETINKIESGIEQKKEHIIDINPFYRFSDIFYILLNPNEYALDKNLRDSLLNILTHFLGELDLYLGQNKKDIIVKEIVKNIKNGVLGEEVRKDFEAFKEYEKTIIADILHCMYNYLGMIDSFKKAVKQIFKDSLIYDKLTSDTNVVVYLNYPKNIENQTKIKFIKEMFLPLGIEIDLFWEKHFGVLGVDITMQIGEIAVF